MKACLIILNYKDANRCIMSAQKASQIKNIDRIVIVDNNSGDLDWNLLQAISIVKCSVCETGNNQGFAAGNNFGAQYAITNYNPEYLFFINPDIHYDETCINKCIELLNNEKDIGLVAPLCSKPNGQRECSAWKFPTYLQYLKYCFYLFRMNSLNVGYDCINEEYDIVDVVRGSFMCFRTSDFIKAGMFDERTFLYNEENIVAKRLSRIDKKVARITNAECIHDHINYDGSKLNSIKASFDSNYYYLCEYTKVSFVKKMLLKICMQYGIFEQRIIESVKKILKRGKNEK